MYVMHMAIETGAQSKFESYANAADGQLQFSWPHWMAGQLITRCTSQIPRTAPLGHYAITTANSGRAAGPFSSLNSNWDSESSSGRAHACHVIHTFCWRSISPLLTLSLGTFLSLSPGIFLPLSIWVSLSTYLPLIAFQPSISRWSCCSFCLPVGSTSVSHSFSRALREKKVITN